MPEKSKLDIFKKVFVIGSGLVFVGMMCLPLFDFLQNPSNQSTASNPQNTKQTVDDKKLQQIAQGYEEVLKREPDNVTALRGLAETRLGMNDLQGAIETIEKLSKLETENFQYVQALSQLYLRTNNKNGATELTKKVEKLVQSSPDNPQYLQVLAELYLQTNNVTEANKLKVKAEKMVASAPNNPQYLQLLAQLRLQTQDLAGAVETMKQLQALYPEDANLKQAIDKLEEEVAKKNPATQSIPASPSEQK